MKKALLMAASLLLVAAACSSDGTPQAEAGLALQTASAREMLAPSLDGALEVADLVVVGRIVSVSDGRALGDPRKATVTFSEAIVDVTQVLRGPADTSTVVVEETAVVSGQRATINDSRPPERGKDVLLLLVRKDGETASDGKTVPYRLISSQGRFFLHGDGSVDANYRSEQSADSANPSNSWVHELAKLDREALVARVRNAASR